MTVRFGNEKVVFVSFSELILLNREHHLFLSSLGKAEFFILELGEPEVSVENMFSGMSSFI